MRLCERCPYPSRAATHSLVITSGTYRAKQHTVYLCAGCVETEGAAMKAKTYGKQMPKSEARPLGTSRPKPAGKKKIVEPQKKVDSRTDLEVGSLQDDTLSGQGSLETHHPQAPVDSVSAQAILPHTSRRSSMTLTLKNLSKNGKRAIYTGAAQSINFNVGLFPDKTAPASIEIADGVFVVKAEKVAKAKLTKEERAALPRPTLAEKIARREELLARDKAKLAAASAM